VWVGARRAFRTSNKMKHRLILAGIVAVTLIIDLVGIGWGLPSRSADRLLFGDAEPWSGARIAELTDAEVRRDLERGADVDLNPRERSGASSTATDAERAEVYRRYRLFSHQPDEMITLMAIASMHPGRFDFDPKLYQYGGLFIYPVAALLKAGSVVGAVELRNDVTWYLDHPEAFARFYVVARLYVVAFALAGVIAVYLLTCRLANPTAGLVAAGFVALMPITVNMAHEAKPHLPAAVLMLYAVLAALRYVDRPSARSLVLLGVTCGLSFGMVLSGWVIFLVLPVVALLRHERWSRRVSTVLIGGLVGAVVYAISNPYVVINALTNRALLMSNLDNSTAMYRVVSPGVGLVRTAGHVAEGMSPLLAVTSIAAVVVMVSSRHWRSVVIALTPAGVVLLNMVLVGAPKPGEFGRFAVFADMILAVMVAAAAAQLWWYAKGPVTAILVLCTLGVAVDGWRYERGFLRDASDGHTRAAAAAWLAENLPACDAPPSHRASIGVLNDPAPYLTPALNFAACDVIVLPPDRPTAMPSTLPTLLIHTGDRNEPPPGTWWRGFYQPVRQFPATAPRFWNRPTVISWADKPITIYRLALDQLLPRGSVGRKIATRPAGNDGS